MSKIGTRRLLLIVLTAVVLSAVCLPAAAKEILVVTVPGGSFEIGWKKNVIEPFEKQYNCEVVIDRSLTMQTLAKLRAQKDNPQVDVVGMDEVAATQAAAEGLLEKLDPAKIPNLKNIHPFFKVDNPYYVKYLYVSQVIAYNTDYIKTPPTSYEILWDPKYKGRVAIPDINTSHGIYLLLIAAKMNGGGPKNIDPGFEKIKSLIPNIYTYWTSHDHLAKLFAQGDIWLATWSSDRAQSLAETGAPIAWVMPKEGSHSIESTMAIAKGSPHKDLAEKYINFSLSKAAQLGNARDIHLGPTIKVDVPADLAKELPVSEKQMSLLIRPDWVYINTVRPEWVDRWNREILKQK
ncbi:MAG: ABC transporter substrate-binding protein [Bacillota bacterium]|nr:ABC transporter substrate-binding protein [Bacillota bacterium]